MSSGDVLPWLRSKQSLKSFRSGSTPSPMAWWAAMRFSSQTPMRSRYSRFMSGYLHLRLNVFCFENLVLYTVQR